MATTDPSLALAFNLPPERAVEYFQAKGMRITSGWQDMAAAAHAGSFTVAGVLKADVLQDIRGALDKALAEGLTFQDFMKRLRPQLKARGWWGVAHDPATGEVIPGRAMTPRRLRTVFQTNMQSAYMAGRYKAQLENADRRPFWQYVAILDSRTRPRHRSLNGRIFRYDDPAWGVIYPPNGYNCRCRVKALSADEFESSGGALSKGEGRLEDIEVDLGPRGGKVSVTGYRDPGTGRIFAPDPGFDSNPGQGAFGVDMALARRVQALTSREVRTQVWQALNNSPERLAAYRGWMNRVLDTGRAGNSAQVVGFVDEPVAEFMTRMLPEESPSRVVAINERRLLHADSEKHRTEGIALSRDQYSALPGIVAKPDAVYFDRDHRNFVYVRRLTDGGVLYVALEQAYEMKRVGQIDALVNAYRLDAEAAKRLETKRFMQMREG